MPRNSSQPYVLIRPCPGGLFGAADGSGWVRKVEIVVRGERNREGLAGLPTPVSPSSMGKSRFPIRAVAAP